MNNNTIIAKLQKLEEAKIKLKSEYVGIDNQIDKLIQYITPWYCTPEILDKPVVIFLAGLTGNGKTSVVRKLLNFLEIEKQVYFDCGEEASAKNSLLSEKLKNVLDSTDITYDDSPYSLDNNTVNSSCSSNKTIAFIFDEFQYSRSIDEEGCEIDKGNIRAIWNLIDSGVIDLTSQFNRKQGEFSKLLGIFNNIYNSYPDLQLNKLKIVNHIDELKEEQIFGSIANCCYDYCFDDGDDDLNNGSKESCKIIYGGALYFIRASLDYKKLGAGREFIKELNNCTTLEEFINLLNEKKIEILKPSLINCSKSIVFLLGNIDEAFNSFDNISPDIDADTYHELTSKVNITDIKNALKQRLRVEQISRLGNNIIIYPSLDSNSFKEIIIKELNKLKDRTKSLFNINFSDKLVKLIYSESVFPAQGVRPTISSVYSIISPLISEIYLKLNTDLKDETISEINLDVKEDNFDTDEATIILKYIDKHLDKYNNDSSIIFNYEHKIQLVLGQLRNTNNDKYNNIKAIHEAGHTVAYTFMTGNLPTNVVSLTTDGGGYMEETIGKSITSNCSFNDIDNKVIVSLAGYISEHEFFEHSKCTIGASSDFNCAWNTLTDAAYLCGYFKPGKFCAEKRNSSQDGRPVGIGDRFFYNTDDNDELEESYLENDIKKKFDELVNKTKTLIKNEKSLVKEIALQLASNRILKSNDIENLINNYAKTFSIESMKMKKSNNEDYKL